MSFPSVINPVPAEKWTSLPTWLGLVPLYVFDCRLPGIRTAFPDVDVLMRLYAVDRRLLDDKIARPPPCG